MKKIMIPLVFLILAMLLTACHDSVKPGAGNMVHRRVANAKVVKLGWKAIFEEAGNVFQLYVTVDGEMDFYAGEWFYILKRSDTELVVMNHPVIYPEWAILGEKE